MRGKNYISELKKKLKEKKLEGEEGDEKITGI